MKWRTMKTAPLDGTVINVVGRYPNADAGYGQSAVFGANGIAKLKVESGGRIYCVFPGQLTQDLSPTVTHPK
jgi:hypothetical protein